MKRIGLLLSIPILCGLAEMCDVAAAARMSGYAVMLVYRVVALFGGVILWLAAGRPNVPLVGAVYSATCALIILIEAPLYFIALKTNGPTMVSVASACSPIVVMALSHYLLGERLSKMRITYILLAVFFVALASLEES